MKRQTKPKPRVMIVEDQAIIAADLEASLKNLGYESCGIENTAEKALKVIEKEQPDAVLMDIVLKGQMDGIEAAEIIRSRWQIPVIFCTGYADESRLQKAKLTLPFGYILKPFDERNIKVTFEMALYIAEVDTQRQKVEEDLRVHQVELEQQNEELQRVQLGLETARDKYSDLYDFAPVGYFTVSKKGLIEEANLSGASLLGVERGQLNKKPFFRFIAPDFQDVFYIHHNRVLETGIKQTCELKLMQKQGTSFAAQLESIAVPDDQGNFNRIRTAVLDITGRKKDERALKESKEKFKSISSSLNDALITINHTGEITYWNQVASEIFGYNPEEVLGQDLHRLLVPQKYMDAFKKGFQMFSKTGAGAAVDKTLELSALRKDGTQFPIELSLASYQVNGKWNAVGTIRDITDRKSADQEKEKLISGLRKALKEVKQLRGLIPICSNCKKVRQDNGYWEQIETYIHQHSKAEFSHGICPACAKELYPDFDLYDD